MCVCVCVTHGIINGINRLLARGVRGKVEHLLLKANVPLVEGKLARKLVRLGRHVKGYMRAARQLRNLKGAYPGDDAAVLRDRLGAHNDHVDLPQQSHDVRHRRSRNLRHGDALFAERFNHAVALLGAGRVADVDDAKLAGPVLGGALEDGQDGARVAVGEDGFALGDEAPAGLGDARAGGDGAGGKEAAVAEEVLADGVEAAVLLLEGGDEVLQEEVGAGRERDGVLDRCLEALAVRLDRVERLVDGGGWDRVEELDEGLDGGDGLGQVRVLGEEVAVCRDDAASTVRFLTARETMCGVFRTRNRFDWICAKAAMYSRRLFPVSPVSVHRGR